LKQIKGILADIDGTLYFKGSPIPGAIEAVEKLRKKDIKLLFFTNTDSKSPRTMFNTLIEYGFSIKEREIFTPIIALKEFLAECPDKKIYLVTTEEVKEEFQMFRQIKGSEVPDFVIIGDFHDKWDVNRLNIAFKYVIKHKAKLLGTQGNKYYLDQFRTAGNPSVGVENGFIFKYRNWLMQGEDGHDRLKAENDQFAFDLQLESTQPVVNHGNEGIISLGFAGSSYYYSRTRMKVTGTLKVDGTTELVEGISWFDHQWGNFTSIKLSWDWFSLQLDNGVDLMIYQLRDKQGKPVNYAATVSKKGETEILGNTEFVLTPGQNWVSDKTGNSYPVTWNLKIPKKKIDIKIQGIIKNSEFDAKLTTFLTYWEGAVKVEGSHTGRGFMELNGYGPESK